MSEDVENDLAGEMRDESDEKVGPKRPPKKYRFSSTNQPDRSKSLDTKRKKKDLREAMKNIMHLPFKFADNSVIGDRLRKLYGKGIEKMTLMELITLQQANKALLQGDTRAAEFCANHTVGMPKITSEITGKDGAPLDNRATIIHVQSIDKLPDIKEDEDDIDDK